MMRDAFEDFEYFYLLNELIKKHAATPEAGQAAELIKNACDTIVPQYEAYLESEGYGWKKTKWEFDAAKLRNYRQQLADMIVKLQGK